MRRLQKTLTSRARAGSRAISEPLRRQSAKTDASATVDARSRAAVEVRSKGYGPSRDLVRNVRPHSRVVVETRLHPSDIEVQRSVLSLTMPSLADVSVVNRQDYSKYQSTPMPPPPLSAGSGIGSADMQARFEILESSVEQQLAVAANLVVQRVASTMGTQLTELEVRQSQEAQGLSSMVMRCIRSELKRTGSLELAPSGTGSTGLTAASIEEITRRVSQQVSDALQEKLTSAALTAEALEQKVENYFTRLETSMKGAIPSGASEHASTPSTALSDEMRAAVASAVGEATQLQRESLVAVLEDMTAEQRARSEGSTAGSLDVKALEEFIEGSLRVATDDIRHSVTAEVKKAMKQRGSASSSSKDGTASTSVDAEAVEELSDRLDAAATATRNTLNHVEAMHEEVSAVRDEQRNVLTQLESIKTLLEQQLPSSTGDGAHTMTGDSVASISAATESAVRGSMEELKGAIADLSAAVEVGHDTMEKQLLSVAQAVSESVLAAVEAKSGQALATAVSVLDEKLRDVLTMQESSGRGAPPLAAVATSADVSAGKAEIAAVIEEVLATKLQEVATRIESAFERSSTSTERQAELAQSISDAVVAALAKSQTAASEQPAPTQLPADLPEKLDLLRTDLVAAVEREMGKTHEVNLSPMYKYVDSMLTFLKEEFSSQESSVDKKIEAATARLAELIESSARTQQAALDKLSTTAEEADRARTTEKEKAALDSTVAAKLDELASKEDLKRLLHDVESTVSAAATAAAAASNAAATEKSLSDAANAPPKEVDVTSHAIDKLAAAVSRANETALSKELGAVKDSLRSLTAEQERTATERIQRALADVESRSARVSESLQKLQDSASAQTEALQAIRSHAEAAAAFGENSATVAERITELNTLRAEAKQRVDRVSSLMDKISGGSSGAGRAATVKQVSEELSALQTLRQKEVERLDQLMTLKGVKEGRQAAAHTEFMRKGLDQAEASLQAKLTAMSAAQDSSQRSLLEAVQSVLTQLQHSQGERLKKEEVAAIVEGRLSAAEKSFTSAQKSSTKSVTEKILSEAKTIIKDTADSQAAAVVVRVAQENEKQVMASLKEELTQQTTAVKSVIAEGANREREERAKSSVKLVEDVASAAEKSLERLLAAQRNVHEPVASKAHVPLWWLVANPLIVCISVVACAYYLFACFLVAFVPKPITESAVTGGARSRRVGGDQTNAASDAVSGSTSAGKKGRGGGTGTPGRRVVDTVL